MSGFNITETTGTYRDMTAVPIEAQKKFVLNYCNQNPSLELAKAVMELYLPLKTTPPRLLTLIPLVVACRSFDEWVRAMS